MIQNYRDILIGLHGFPLLMAVLFTVLYLIRTTFLFLFTGRILFQNKQKSADDTNYPLSVFLTIRNNEDDLKNFLPHLLTINEIDYEVIVVDDFSQDNSFLVLGALRKEFTRLKISTLNEETRFSMKLSQNIAIKAAKFDWVLPVPPNFNHKGKVWLSGFANELTDTKTVVLGYSTIKSKTDIFNLLYRIENYFSFVKSVGFITNNLPVVYSEENVAFRTKKYFELGGYGSKIKEPYANLELLINKFIQKKATTVLFSKEYAIEKTNEIVSGDYLDLLKKSFRIEKHLSRYMKLALRFEEITRLLFLPLLLIVTILLSDIWILFALLVGLKIIAHSFIIKLSQNRLNERKIFIPSLVYEMLIPYFRIFYRWYFNYRSRKNKWRSKV